MKAPERWKTPNNFETQEIKSQVNVSKYNSKSVINKLK